MPGWFDQAVEWIQARLNERELTPTRPVEQVKMWSISCILRIATARGDLYFKAVPPLFAHEPVLTQALSGLYPPYIPEVLAIDAAQYWMLMKDFGDTPLARIPAIERWEESARLLARIQIESIERIDSLSGMGCPDRRLLKLPEHLDTLLEDTPAMQFGSESALSDDEVAHLRSLAPAIASLCDRLAGYGIPATLIHGDFHPYNINVIDQDILIYDWTDGSIAHPFFDLYTLRSRDDLIAIPDIRLRNAYLETWTAYSSMDRLIQAFDLSRKIAPLYHAISYHSIALSLEESAKSELAGGVPYFLRMFLENL